MEQAMPHSLSLESRRQLTVTGVIEVLRFEDTAAVLRTSQGVLLVQGQELRLRTLSLEGGKMEVAGTICGLFYEQARRSWKERLLG